MNNQELLPCPFCGGKAKLWDSPFDYFVACNKCKSRTGDHSKNMEHRTCEEASGSAIQAWNKRI